MMPAGAHGSGNPFPGLRPFREDEEALFFGREAQIDTLVDTLAATRFLAVVGTSGSGKSSLVNCGLVPALHRGLLAASGSGWRVATMRPGHRPIHALAQALAAPGVLPQPDAEAAGFSAVELVESTLRMGKLGLLEAYRESMPPATADGAGGARNLLVVVDQFEELFRYRALAAPGLAAPAAPTGEASASETAIAFVNLLLEVAAQHSLPVYVVLTMRSDFLGDCAQFHGLPEAINRGQYLVPRMSRDERRAAIVGPLRVCGADIDPVLLTRLVNDVGDNPDQLSILQHALNRTWARWRDDGGQGPLTLRHYEAVGTMAHALNQHAEEAFAELPEGRPRALCEALFKAITDTGTDARGTRRPTRLDALCAITGATADELGAVMAVFRDPSRAFLMPPHGAPLGPDTPVDISHESLMRVWQRLRDWGDDEAQSAQTYRRLAETAELQASGQAGLLGPPELQVALAWRERRRPTAAWARRYRRGFDAAMAFLDESAQAFDATRQAEAARQDEAVRLRQEALRSRQNRRWWMAVAPLAAAAIAGLGYLYLQASLRLEEAQAQASIALRERAEATAAAASAAQALAEREQAELALRRLQDAQKAQAQVLSSVAQTTPQLRDRIEQAAAAQALVYLQYAEPEQQATAERLRRLLDDLPDVRAPAIERVATVPTAHELRYFRDADAETARQLGERIERLGREAGGAGFGNVRVKSVSGYETRSAVRQFEFWMARPASTEGLDELVRRLDAPAEADRRAALQILRLRYSASPDATAKVLDLLAPSRRPLSAAGLVNALYFLARSDPSAWTPDLERRARDTVERFSAGKAIGQQAQAEFDRLVGLLDTLRLGRSGAAAKKG